MEVRGQLVVVAFFPPTCEFQGSNLRSIRFGGQHPLLCILSQGPVVKSRLAWISLLAQLGFEPTVFSPQLPGFELTGVHHHAYLSRHSLVLISFLLRLGCTR